MTIKSIHLLHKSSIDFMMIETKRNLNNQIFAQAIGLIFVIII